MSLITNINDRDIQKIDLENNLLEEDVIVGSFPVNSGKIQLINVNKEYNNLKETEIEIQGYGIWYVSDIKPVIENVSIELQLFNVANRFDVDYEDTFSFPNTLENWAIWIGNKVGVPLGNVDFTNSDYILNEKPYFGDKPSYREAIKLIARYAGSFVMVENNQYFITWFNDDLTELNDWLETTPNNEKETVNIVVLGKGGVEDNIKYPEVEPENPVELRIDDEFLNISREELIVPIYNQVNGFKYTPVKIKTVGLLNFKVGSKVKFLDLDDNEIETYVMNHRLEYQGGPFADDESWISYLETKELKETNTKYQYAKSLEKRLIRAERNTDKLNGEIVDVVSTVSQTQTDVNNNFQEIINKFGDYAPLNDILTIEKSVKKLQTDTYTKTEITQKLTDGSVTKVQTMSGTFDDSGMNYEKTGAPTKSTINEVGFTIKEATGASNNELLFAGYDKNLKETVVRAKNFKFEKYFNMGTNSRMEDYEDGTGVFDV